MEKEKSRGRTRRKQPSRIASFLYHEGRRWCAAALSLCLILNNMASITWAAELVNEEDILFKLTGSSLYEALQEAVQKGNIVDDHFTFQGKEEDVEAYEKLLLLDDDLYELKPEFENKDKDKNKELQLRIFASLGWETDPDKEYQVVGDEKIIFYLSNTSETEQRAVIQVDEQKTDSIIVVPKSAVVIDETGEVENVEAETQEDADKQTEKEEVGESEGQAENENADGQDAEEGKKPGSGGSSSGGASGGSSNPAGNRNEHTLTDSDTEAEAEKEAEAETETEAESKAETDKEKEASETLAPETKEEQKPEESKAEENSSAEKTNTAEEKDVTEENGSGQESGKNDKTDSSSKPEEEKAEKNDKEKGESDKSDTEKTEDGKEETGKTESVNTDKEKTETEKTESGKAESGKAESDKADSGKTESENTDKEKTESVKTENTDKEQSKPEKSENSKTEQTKTEKTDKTESENSKPEKAEKTESKKTESEKTKDDNSSDEGKTVSAVISRNRIQLVAESLEDSEKASASDAKNKETASASDAEDKEIEGDLYEPVVVDKESVTIFVTTAKELGLDNAAFRKASASNAERISPAYEGEVDLGNVIVQVKADENVLPENVKLQVKELKEDGEEAEQYVEAKEALDSQGTEYDEMMAFDISFLDKDGKEIEPDGNVQVSIKLKKEALPEKADLESIAVQHLAENEGEITVEEVADCGEKTKGKVEVDAEEHVEAEFEVDSFSVFTVTWVSEKTELAETKETAARFTINFYYKDEQGNSYPIETSRVTIPEELKINGKKIGEKYTIELDKYFEKVVQGYSYKYAEFTTTPYSYQEINGGYYPNIIGTDDEGFPIPEKSNTIENKSVTNIMITKLETYGMGGLFAYLITMEDGEGNLNHYPCGAGIAESEQDNTLKALDVTLNLYYEKTDLGILNTITENGLLTADGKLEEGQRYVWYKWKGTPERPEDAERVEVRQVTGSKWNIVEDGKALNVAYDEGAQHYYLVTIQNEDGTEVAASRPFFVNYSDKLINGGFETPVLPSNGKGWNQYDNGFDGLEWKSTTGNVEIVNNKSSQHYLNIAGGEAEKNQCAELNPEKPGALYQDVLTAPGAELYWSLLHRARGGENGNPIDKMHVIIMPTAKAEEQLKQRLGDKNPEDEVAVNKALSDMIDDILKNPDDYPDSTRVWEDIESPRFWTRHSGAYTVGEEQYLTRFFFIAGETAAGSTQGNLLDDVSFGTELPPIDENRGDLSITKVITGLSDEDIKGGEGKERYNITLKISAPASLDWGNNTEFKQDEHDENIRSKTITLNTFTSNDGMYVEAKMFSNLPAGTYTIEELSISPKEYNESATVSMNKITKQSGNETVGDSILEAGMPRTGKIKVTAGGITFVRITNAYPKKQKTENFKVKKKFQNGKLKAETLMDEFGDVEFALYSTDETWSILDFSDVTLTPVITQRVQLENSNENESNDVIGTIDFSDIPEGYYFLHEQNPPTGYQQAVDKRIFVGEKEGTFGVYLVEYDEQTKNDIYEKVSEEDHYVEVVNEEEENSFGTILPDTGGPGLAMFERYGWFLLMLALLMAGVEVRCYGERKYRRATVAQHKEFEDSP